MKTEIRKHAWYLLILQILFIQFLIFPRVSSGQEMHQFEIFFQAVNCDLGDFQEPAQLVVQKQSTIWEDNSSDTCVVYPTGQYGSYDKLLSYPLDETQFNHIVGPNPGDSWDIGWGVYEFAIQYKVAINDSTEVYQTFASLRFDGTDRRWCGSNPTYSADFHLQYVKDDGDYGTFYYKGNNDADWTQCTLIDSAHWSSTVWEILAPPNYTPYTSCFVPEAPKNFSVVAYNGYPRLSWTSNGESFQVQYKIYKNGNYQALTSNTCWIDTDISGAGSGPCTASYYVKTINGTLESASTATQSINYWPGFEKSSTMIVNPDVYYLLQNYPNPFNPSTEITYNLPADEFVSLKIYNTIGQEIKSIISQKQSAGLHKAIWDGKNNSGQVVPTGIYLYRLQAGSYTRTMKMLLVK